MVVAAAIERKSECLEERDALVATLVILATPTGASAQTIPPAEAQAIAKDAYVYLLRHDGKLSDVAQAGDR